MIELMNRQKESLKTLVKLQREGAISDEFRISWTGPVPSLYITKEGKFASVEVKDLTILSVEALTRAGFVFSIPHQEQQCHNNIAGNSTNAYYHETHRDCYITPAGFRAVDSDFAQTEDILMRRPPVEITRSLADLRTDYPDPSRLAFVMMEFGKTKRHEQIYAAIRHALDPHNFVTLRADSKEYHEDLWFNILTYMYGCRFGIAVFERIDDEVFNPNVSLEVGHTSGLGKPVCYLKEQTLPKLHTDLVGRLYREFDLDYCDRTVSKVLWKWMSDKGILIQQTE